MPLKAVAWYQRAADSDNAAAMNSLGFCYEHGVGVVEDSDLSVAWYRRAAVAGHAGAKSNLPFYRAHGA